MRKAIKAIDDHLFNEALRRAIIHGRRAHGLSATNSLGRTVAMVRRERTLPEDAFLYRTPIPRFVGGTTGRSGTKWLMRVFAHQLSGGDPVAIGEHGTFVLSMFRAAPYEYYQLGSDDAVERRAGYVDFFLRQYGTYAFRRRRIYGGAGTKGLIRYVPHRAIEIAGRELATRLAEEREHGAMAERFGDFYLHLLNYHAALFHGRRAGWINKEPPYGRHADDLFRMVPHARLVVLARDGRATALSMLKRRWMPTIRGCMDRWAEFTRMTIDAVTRCPENQVLVVRYEDLVREFERELPRVFSFFELPPPDVGAINDAKDRTLRPQPASLDRWKDEIATEDIDWFNATYGDLLAQLGYTE